MTTKKEERKQKNVLSKGAVSLLGLGVAVVYLFLGYETLYLNAYPALMKGYYPFAIVMIIVFIVVTIMFTSIVGSILSSKTYKQLLKA